MKYLNIVLFIIFIALVSIGLREPSTSAQEIDTINAKNYLQKMSFTEAQIEYTLSKCEEVRDCNHFVSWFGAINRHEVGGTFIDGKTNFLAGRLKKGMAYKSFNTQLDGRVESYNKYRYKHNTVSGRLDHSHYCVSDTHGGGKGCPNWKRSVTLLRSKYGATDDEELILPLQPKLNNYIRAKNSQDKLDRAREATKKALSEEKALESTAREARKECIESGECKE